MGYRELEHAFFVGNRAEFGDTDGTIVATGFVAEDRHYPMRMFKGGEVFVIPEDCDGCNYGVYYHDWTMDEPYLLTYCDDSYFDIEAIDWDFYLN